MNQIDLPNKRAIVTGGARGIGFGVAQRLQRSEAKVCLWDSDADALATAIQALSSGGEVRTARVDLADAEQVQVAADVLAQEWGGGDILLNNAGITGGMPLRGKLRWPTRIGSWTSTSMGSSTAVVPWCLIWSNLRRVVW